MCVDVFVCVCVSVRASVHVHARLRKVEDIGALEDATSESCV